MRLLVALVVLAALLVAGDRAAAAVAERMVAERVTASGVTADATVDVRGVPFLTQAVRGRYHEVVVQARDVQAGEVRLAAFEATLTGLRVPLRRALSGDVSAVPVEGLRARALVPYTEFARRVGAAAVRVEPAGDRVRVTGTVEVLGRTVSAATVSRVELTGRAVVVTAESFDVGNPTISEVLTRALTGRLDVQVPLTRLPYGLTPRSVEVTPTGVAVEATATDVVITAG